ncbi:MAG: hypothetical protein K8S56_03125, partial [Candidatus Cloacimonetes bacterium]|nr:hypothetical protein [Candidatus Cloacimonadota bacterium]
MNNKILLVIAIIVLSLLVGCKSDSKKTTGPPDSDDLSGANQLAREGFVLLNQEILNAEESGIDNPVSGNDIFSEAIYEVIKGKFNDALALDADNPMAHFGLAILETASINYDEEFWGLYNDMNDEFEDTDRTLFKNQFTLLAKAPQMYLYPMTRSFNAEEKLSFARFQNLIQNSLLPKIENSIAHLSYAISLADSNTISLDNGEEILEIDCGEIFVFRASIYAVSATFRMLALYDMELFDDNDSYDWIHEMDEEDDDEDDYTSYTVVEDNEERTLILRKWDFNTEDSLLSSVLLHNYNRPDFMKIRSGQNPNEIQNDLLCLVEDMEAATDYIEAEADNQSDDVIKFSYIVD